MLKSGTRPPCRTRFLRRVAAVSFGGLVTAVGVAVAPSPAHAAWFIEGVYPSFFDCQNVENPTSGDHFHTVDVHEYQSAQQLGYVYEGLRARI